MKRRWDLYSSRTSSTNKTRLEADVVLVSDTASSPTTCSITTGLRGLSYVEVEVTGPNRDLHSGSGGAAPNPINILCEMIASLKDEHQQITVEGFYDDVEVLSDDERSGGSAIQRGSVQESIDIDAVEGEAGYSAPDEHPPNA